MPAAYNSTALASVKVTVMSNASEIGNSASATYATIPASHMNNVTTNVSKQGVSGAATKYIQLQSVRPSSGQVSGINSNQVHTTAIGQTQRMTNPMASQGVIPPQRQQTTTTPTSGITVPPGRYI